MEDKVAAADQFRVGPPAPGPLVDKIVAEPGWHSLQFVWIHNPEHDYTPEDGGETVHLEECYVIRATAVRSDKEMFYVVGAVPIDADPPRVLMVVQDLLLTLEGFRACSCKVGPPCEIHK